MEEETLPVMFFPETTTVLITLLLLLLLLQVMPCQLQRVAEEWVFQFERK